ncbi:hypothetical protein TNCV_2620241 [Trichonephila clavipes]|uniref:Uncharacterized protein n=1 Tax=Trichonephila clavipes TaxID=2585209 RepID=A0A8X6WC71_TRICX|nr:hypothetical protein TNCV_2620241 [Trichonephila clavipes]
MQDLDDQQPSEKDVQREAISNAPTEKCLENVGKLNLVMLTVHIVSRSAMPLNLYFSSHTMADWTQLLHEVMLEYVEKTLSKLEISMRPNRQPLAKKGAYHPVVVTQDFFPTVLLIPGNPKRKFARNFFNCFRQINCLII